VPPSVIGLQELPPRLLGAVIGQCYCRQCVTHVNESLAIPAIGSEDGVMIVRLRRLASG
jgi:hypothetical protein